MTVSAPARKSALHFELQHFQVGDAVPISAVHGMVFHRIEPERGVVWAGTREERPGAFAWMLYPAPSGGTRLVSRIGWTHHWRDPAALLIDPVTENADHIAVRKVPGGIKDRVEGRIEPFVLHIFELLLLLLAGITFTSSLVFFVAFGFGWRRWAAMFAAGVGSLADWYGPLPVVASAGLVAASTIVVLAAHRSSQAGPDPSSVAREAAV